MEHRHGPDDGYAQMLRRNAHAIRDITDDMQPWVVGNEDDPILRRMWQNVSPRDDVMGAGEHHSELACRLDINS